MKNLSCNDPDISFQEGILHHFGITNNFSTPIATMAVDNLSCILKQHSKNFQSGITFVSSGRQDLFLPYGDLYSRSLDALELFQQSGIEAGSKFIFQIEENESFLVHFWACVLGRITPIPLTVGSHYEHHLKTMNVCSQLSNAFLLITPPAAIKLSKWFPDPFKNKPILSTDTIELFSLDNISVSSQPIESGEQIAFIQYSSGSTGEPKGVAVSHTNALSNLQSIVDRIEVSQYDTLLSWLPLTHDMGLIFVSMVAIMSGAGLCLIPPKLYMRQPALWLKKTGQYKASLLYTTNFGLKYLHRRQSNNDHESYDLSSVRSIYNAAEPVSYMVCQNFFNSMSQHGLNRNTMHPCYGLAEATVAVTVPSVTEKLTSHTIDRNFMKIGDTITPLDPLDPKAFTTVEVGHPLPGCEVRIIDNDQKLLDYNHIGHIEIRGKNVISRYYSDRPDADTIESGWTKTGDIGYMTNGNRLVVVDRIKNIVIHNGNNIYFSDIERVIEEMATELTGRVAAINAYNTGNNESLIILVHPKGYMTREHISKQIKGIISKKFGISVYRVCFVKNIPKTTSGKIQHHKLKMWYALKHDITGNHQHKEHCLGPIS